MFVAVGDTGGNACPKVLEIDCVTIAESQRDQSTCDGKYMGIFEKLKNTLTVGKLKKDQIERLRQSIWTAVADGFIDDRELEYINGCFLGSDLTVEEFQSVRTEVFCSIVQQAIADRRVNASELKTINHIIERLEIPREVEAWAEAQVQYYVEIARIEAGGELRTGNPTGLILQKGEVCYASIPASLIEERVVARNYVGGNQGLNVRIMKGVSYRIGQQRGQMTSQSGMVQVSDGYFIVTNKRLVFSGTRKSVSTPYSKLLDLHVYADGLNFSSASRQKPVIVRLSRIEEADMCGVLISRIINEQE